MRSLERNKQTLFYVLYEGKIDIVDEMGDYTGEQQVIYSEPVFFMANISAGKGMAQDEVFGKNLDYTRTISSTDMSLPINEYSLVYYDTNPLTSTGSADYEVVAVARGLNSIMLAIKKLK